MIEILDYKIDYKDRQIRNIIILYCISVFYWITLVIYREIKQKDIKVLRKNIILNCNGWCMSHFIHYLILGYCAPKYWIQLIIIGIIFELIEIPLNNLSKYIDIKLLADTFTNSLGVMIGVILFKLFPYEIDLYKLLC